MFGAGVPVTGWSKYEAWPELVKEDVNGLGFGSAQELYDVLRTLFKDDPAKLKKLRAGVLEEGKSRWENEWSDVAAKVFRLDI